MRNDAVCLALAISMAAAGSANAKRAVRAPFANAPRGRSWAVLAEALRSRDYSVRLLATETLGHVKAVDATAWLEYMLGDPEHDVRVVAVDALGRLGSARALELLRTVRDDTGEALDVRALAAATLIASVEQPKEEP